MITTLFVIFVLLLMIFGIGAICMPYRHELYDDVDETVITTTTVVENVEPTYTIVGKLNRQHESSHSQYFVIDPVDGDKIFLNDNDDLYEDADGKIWSLV